MSKLNEFKVIYEWKYVVPNGDINKPEDIGDRLELRKYDDGSFVIACFAYENDDGKRDALIWFNTIDQDALQNLAKTITEES